MKRVLLLLSMAAVRLCAGGADAATATLDAAKTEVGWELAGNVHTTHGTFKLKQGTLTLNVGSHTMGGAVVIDATSGESGNGTRDHRMHAEVIESTKYPEIRFTPASWQGELALSGSSKIQVAGVLEVHGAKHDITLPVELSVTGRRFKGSTQFDIPYVQWGMKDPSNFLFRVEKKVTLHITAEGDLAPSGT